VAIGRAIVRQPKVFLFDEPLSNLDAALRVQMRLELARMHQDFKTTMIYVTHDQVEAMTLADRIVVLNNGIIEQVGAPLELYRDPANLFVAGFIGSPKMNFVSTTVTAIVGNSVSVALPGGATVAVPAEPAGLAVGDPVTLGLRPDHLVFTPDGQLAGTAMVVEHLGGDTYVYVQVDDGPMLVLRGPAETPVLVAERVRMQVRTEQASLFDRDGNAKRRPEERQAAAQ
jgi:multiple sugar transport system ATP-binding protein